MAVTWLATRIAGALAFGDVAFIADDEQRAEALAAAVRALAPGNEVIFVPSSDALPGDDAAASPGNSGRRVAALARLVQKAGENGHGPIACIASAEATARLYPPPRSFAAAPPRLAAGMRVDLRELGEQLAGTGYFTDDRVDEPGEMSVLGDVLDLFPADAELPVRVEARDGEIVSLRSYDPISQRSVAEIEHIEIGQASEPPVGDGVPLLDHFPTGVIVFDGKVNERRARFLALTKDAVAHGARAAAGVDPKQWERALAEWRIVEWSEDATPVPRFVEKRAPMASFSRWVRPQLAGGARLVLAGGARDLRFLGPRMAKALGVNIVAVESWQDATAVSAGNLAILVMPATEGFVLDDLIVVTAADLLGSRAIQGDATTVQAGFPGPDSNIRIGDVIIHEDHGIAVVAGIEAVPAVEDGAADAVVLEHAGGARRLVPVDQADRIWRYGADADAVTLDKLDGSSWQKRRTAIDQTIAESARGLTAIAEERALVTAPRFEPDHAAYERFAAGFAFTETPDQARAIAAVRDDLASGKSMNRLVIGDVGYGKTEIALRAAAMVALAGGQVAIAAPTTVLVRQHFELLQRRFGDTGIAVATLSRLSTTAEKKAVKAGLADGSIGVVVGTAAVAGKDVRYQNLALTVIDEEQRFGTADKAKLRGGGETHVLTLTATPIPRTLQAALVGLQQMSVIATPPARRQPIRTTVDVFDDTRVRTALVREKWRGGQSFVVVPRIEDMAPLAEKLARIAPELSVVEAHGKLPAAELDEAMVRFASGRGDVLLATNIIEAGLDVPRANTMIVWRADRFGLSQLHQLRGRVGRGGRRGQILLLTAGDAQIAESTMKRLRTLQAFDRLGAGFAISAHDLDMRGAGDLLGDAQAGHMKLIGVDLYQHLLGAALQQARGETIERWTPELNLGSAGSLPDSWIPEVDIRVGLYCRLARIESVDALDALEEELEDRFGTVPPEASALMAIARIRALARSAGVARVNAGPGAIAITPRAGVTIDGVSFGMMLKEGRWILAERIENPEARLARVIDILAGVAEV